MSQQRFHSVGVLFFNIRLMFTPNFVSRKNWGPGSVILLSGFLVLPGFLVTVHLLWLENH